jgi:NAD(P)H-hydrate epimerase
MEPISFEEVHVLDANSEYRGVPTHNLMESAGRGVAYNLLEMGADDKRVLIICGMGNNGGDGYVAARYLAGKCHVDIVLLRPRGRVRTELSRHNLQRAEEEGVPIRIAEEGYEELLAAADFVVDAMLGVGVTGAPRGIYAKAVQAINASGKRVVSVDIPTGWGSEMAVQPEVTVTFHAPKVDMGAECGRIVVVPIGIPEEAETYVGPGELYLIPKVATDAHKGNRGTVLVIGGGPFTGAPTLAAMAAYRAGVDLAYLVVPGAIANVVRGFSVDLIVFPAGDTTADHLSSQHMHEIKAAEDRADAVILGPGLGKHTESMELAVQAYRHFAEAGKPIIVDADGLNALAGAGELPSHPKAVLTPHSGEFARLAGAPLPRDIGERSTLVASLAERLGCTVLAKGSVDVISDGSRLKLNDTGNSAMATGGTGDVLSGVVGAYLAKGMEPFDAARAATFVVGEAGDLALSKVGHSMVASDLLEELQSIFSKYIKWWTQR